MTDILSTLKIGRGKEDSSKGALSKTLAAIITVVIVGGALSGVFFFMSQGQSPSSGQNISCSAQTSASGVGISIPNGASSSSNAPGYSPDILRLVIGTNNTVTWTNNDGAAHTVTTSSAPSGASFNSGRMGQGASYTCTFTEPGTYQYYCKYHSWMSGTIFVLAPS